MSKIIERALVLVLLAILADIAAHALSLVVAGVLAAGLDPVASVLQHAISAQK